MGVTIQPLTEELAQSFGLRQARGALINGIMKGSPAEKGGIRQGDVVIAFNGTEVKDPSHLQRLVAEAGIGKPVRVTVFRDAKAVELTIVLMSAEAAPKSPTETDGGRQQGQSDPLGLSIEDVEGEGVVVADLVRGGAAAEVGMKRGDLIVSINRRRVTNSADYQRIVREARGSLTILVRRGDASIYFAVRLK
jgi:serine protease Do/serine protease DegQ